MTQAHSEYLDAGLAFAQAELLLRRNPNFGDSEKFMEFYDSATERLLEAALSLHAEPRVVLEVVSAG